MIETNLEKCRRDVEAGTEQINRQRDLVAHLELYGHAGRLREAKGILATLLHVQQRKIDDLTAEMERSIFLDHNPDPVVFWASL